ncbi:MAG: adenylate/guanylate cyclase domain-containing protein [Reichenbachiella sp.]
MIIADTYDITDHGIDTIKSFGQYRFSFLMIFTGAFLLASLSSALDILIIKKLMKNRSLGVILLTGILVQSGMIIIVMTFMTDFYQGLMHNISGIEESDLKFQDVLFGLVHVILAIAMSKFVIEIERKLGAGNLWKVLSGKFFKPHVEERIFMFIDMKDSTAIAEKIGHLEFSKLLQNCFREFAVAHHFRTEIYQYVGDEVVVSWSPKNGFKNNNFLKAFFAFTEVLERKSDYYQKQFGIRPYFKAGANIGPVVITEVGDVKREIVFHGDTLNTASRIQDMCNSLGAQLLIPETLYHQIQNPNDYQIDNAGSINLKGKEKKVNLYRVARR